jgi:hypothetical protein
MNETALSNGPSWDFILHLRKGANPTPETLSSLFECPKIGKVKNM